MDAQATPPEESPLDRSSGLSPFSEPLPFPDPLCDDCGAPWRSTEAILTCLLLGHEQRQREA